MPLLALDLIDILACLGTLVVVLVFARRRLRAKETVLLTGIVLLTFFHGLADTFKASWMAEILDEYEDYFGVLTAALWAVFFYALVLDIAEQDLRDGEERFRLAYHANPDAIALVRQADQVVTDVNDTFLGLTGFAREQVLGRKSADLGIWQDPGRGDEVFRLLERDGRVDDLEASFNMPGGERKTWMISARKVKLKGVPHILYSMRDITMIKEVESRLTSSLREKEVLLKEIHHRVKNNLQVISGLLNLQARFITDSRGREVYKESQNRVVTMALIHQSLYQAPDLAKVDFSAYLEQLVRKLFSSYGADRRRVRLVFEVEPVELVVDTAIPCGLIVNELVTNVLKHAFIKDGGGEVRLGFRRVENEEYELIVADDGSGLPPGLDFARPPSLGLQLVKVLAEQLGARVTIGREVGTEFRLVFREYHEAGTTLV